MWIEGLVSELPDRVIVRAKAYFTHAWKKLRFVEEGSTFAARFVGDGKFVVLGTTVVKNSEGQDVTLLIVETEGWIEDVTAFFNHLGLMGDIEKLEQYSQP